MSEYNCNSHDNLLQLENFIESSTYEDSQDTQNLTSLNDTPQDDCWQCENQLGSQADIQPHMHDDHQEYYPFTTQTLTDSPPDPPSWPEVHSNGHFTIAPDGDEPDYPSYLTAFLSDPRDLGWTESRWPEQNMSRHSEELLSYPPMELLENHDTRPTNSSCSLGIPIPEESHTPRISQAGAFSEDETIPSGWIHSYSGRGFNFGHMYEPAPSNAVRPSLLTQWTDTSPEELHASLGARSSINSQHSLMDQERSLPPSHAIENVGHYGSSLGFYDSAGSLPDLSCSRRQTPGSGPMDVTSAERPTTPFGSGSGARYERAGCEYSGYQTNDSPRSLSRPLSLSRNSTFLNSAETCSSRSSSIFACGTTSESQYRLTEPIRTTSFDSRRSFCNTLSAISIPSPPQLFASTPITRGNSLEKRSALKLGGLLSPITDDRLQARPKQTDQSNDGLQSGKDSRKTSSRSKPDRPKRKRMHVCNICGKDFNRPSALLLHGTVHTGERSNFCNVCGRSFSNLSNLRRHQRQLHVLESQMLLPEIPGPTSEVDAYNFGSQTRF